MVRCALALVCLVTMSCGGEDGSASASEPSDSTGEDDDDDDDDDDNPVTTASPPADVSSTSGGDPVACPCEGVGDGIYLWFAEGDVVLYHPERNEVTEVGTIACDMLAGYTPAAFAVAADGGIIANLSNEGGAGQVVLSNVGAIEECEVAPPHALAFPIMGLTYVPTAEGCNTVFMFDNSRRQATGSLVRWNDETDERVDVAPSTFAVAELAGTADGRLFAYMLDVDFNPNIVELDPKTGEILTEMRSNVDIGNVIVFAYWHGNVYMIRNYIVDPVLETAETQVVRVDPATGATGVIVPPFRDRLVWGASTPPCQP